MRELLREVLNTLPPYEKKVLALRFGLEDGRIHSVDEVARIFKVSGNTIKTVETKALKKLRQPTCSAKLKDFY